MRRRPSTSTIGLSVQGKSDKCQQGAYLKLIDGTPGADFCGSYSEALCCVSFHLHYLCLGIKQELRALSTNSIKSFKTRLHICDGDAPDAKEYTSAVCAIMKLKAHHQDLVHQVRKFKRQQQHCKQSGSWTVGLGHALKMGSFAKEMLPSLVTGQ